MWSNLVWICILSGEHRRGKRYHKHENLPWGARGLGHILGMPILWPDTGKMSSLAGMESSGISQMAIRNWASALCFLRSKCTDLLTSSHGMEAADWKLLGVLTDLPEQPQHIPQTTLGFCFSSSCYSAFSLRWRMLSQWECTHLEGRNSAWTLSLPLTRVETAIARADISAHTSEEAKWDSGQGTLSLELAYIHKFGRLWGQLNSVASSSPVPLSLLTRHTRGVKWGTSTEVQSQATRPWTWAKPSQRLPSLQGNSIPLKILSCPLGFNSVPIGW